MLNILISIRIYLVKLIDLQSGDPLQLVIKCIQKA